MQKMWGVLVGMCICFCYGGVAFLMFFILIGSKVHMLASTVSSKFLGALAEVEGFQFEVSTQQHLTTPCQRYQPVP